MSNVSGDPFVAAELLNGTTPWTLLDLGDSIAQNMQELYRAMFPARLPFGGQFAFATNGINGVNNNGTTGAAAIGTTLYCGAGNYSINATLEFQANGTAFGTNQNTFWNRCFDGTITGYTGNVTDTVNSRVATTWGDFDWLAGKSATCRSIFYGGSSAPTQYETCIRHDNVTMLVQ